MGFMIFLLIVFKYNPMIDEISNGRFQTANGKRNGCPPEGSLPAFEGLSARGRR